MFMCIQFSYIWVDKKKENLSIEIVMVIDNNCNFKTIGTFFSHDRQNY